VGQRLNNSQRSAVKHRCMLTQRMPNATPHVHLRPIRLLAVHQTLRRLHCCAPPECQAVVCSCAATHLLPIRRVRAHHDWCIRPLIKVLQAGTHVIPICFHTAVAVTACLLLACCTFCTAACLCSYAGLHAHLQQTDAAAAQACRLSNHRRQEDRCYIVYACLPPLQHLPAQHLELSYN
jgi:hypothetical protein